MRRSGFAAPLLMLVIGCGTAVDEPPVAAPPPVTVKNDVEPQLAELQTTIAELIDRIEVLNARMQRIESGSSAETTTRQVERPAAPPAAPPQRAAAQPKTVSTSRRDPITGANIADRYRNALTLYGSGQVDEARRGFEQVLEADPTGELADNALYWIGETYFSRGSFTDAMNTYRRVLAEYPDQNKAPDALLKIGMCHARLGDLGLAKKTFEELIAKYPYSTPASSARGELKRIKY